MNRLDNLDMMRGGAATAVMCCHATIFSQSSIDPVVTDLRSLLVHVGSSSVWLFFAVSGFVISRPFMRSLVAGRPLPDLRSYALKRSARIYPLYWAGAAAIVVAGGGWGTDSLRDRVAHTLLLHNLVPGREHAFIPVAWTLTLEVLFYATLALGALAASRAVRGRPISADRVAATVVAVWIFAALLLATIPAAVENPVHELWLRSSFPTMVGMFAPGLLLALAMTSPPGTVMSEIWSRLVHTPKILTVVGLTGCTLGVLLAAAPVGPDPAPGMLAVWDLSRTAYAVGYGALVARAAIAERWRFPGVRLALYLGTISYGIYLIHGVVLGVFLRHRSWIPFDRPGIDTYAIHLLMLATITITLAALTWPLIERPIANAASDVARTRSARRDAASAPLAERHPAEGTSDQS